MISHRKHIPNARNICPTLQRCCQLNGITKYSISTSTHFLCHLVSCTLFFFSFIICRCDHIFFFSLLVFWCTSLESERRELRCNTMCQSVFFYRTSFFCHLCRCDSATYTCFTCKTVSLDLFFSAFFFANFLLLFLCCHVC